MKRLVESLLARLARAILKKYHPTVIGVTGSVGKSSTKEAVFAVLSERFNVRQTPKSYNTQIGMPLTIIGAMSGMKSFIKWLGVFAKGLRVLWLRDASYPNTLVLEMGLDYPGNIKGLTEIAPCTVGILTSIAPAHTEFVSSLEEITKEKSVVVTHLPRTGYAVLNADDDRVLALHSKTQAHVMTFGLSDHADVRASDIAFTYDGSALPTGMQCTVEFRGERVPITIPGLVGNHQLMAPLAAIATGIALGMTLSETALGVARYQPPAGRMRLIPGIKSTLILDDSYNASPVAVRAALKTLSTLPGSTRRIACLGDMAELGALSDDLHREMGECAAQSSLDMLITVGVEGKKLAHVAVQSGMPDDHVFSFDTSPDAAKFVQERMETGDCILVKGSQVARMEKIVKEIMAEPERASELLVRQDAHWLQIS